MTISHGGYNFEGITTHGIPRAPRPELNDVVDQFMAIKGESEVTDSPHGREIRLRFDIINNYTTWTSLAAAVARIESKINVLSDQSLIITLPWPGESAVSIPHCTFKGFEQEEEAFFDGSGVNGWIQKGWLVWRQLKITT